MARQVCEWCREELSHSAYYRHLRDQTGSICPGKLCGQSNQIINHLHGEESRDSDIDGSESTLLDLDSTFELESDEDDMDHRSLCMDCHIIRYQ